MADLFPDLAPARSSGVSGPRGWAALAKRRRVVECGAPNAVGRSRLTFDYRPMREWTAEQLEQAEGLVELYFRNFGGFRKADQAVMRAWVEALSDFTVAQITAALRQKWKTINKGDAAQVRDARQFIARPENFPATIGRWWDQSPEGQAAAADAARKRDAQRVDNLRARQPDPPSDEAARAARAAARAAQAEAAEQRLRAFWDALTPAQRKAAAAATRDTWKVMCANWGWREDEDQAVEHHQAMSARWATAQWPNTTPINPEDRHGSR